MTREELIEQYIQWGLAVIPVSAYTKIPAVAWKRYQSKRPTNRAIRDWFNSSEKTHPGAVMGKTSGNVFRLDVDSIADFEPIMNLGVIPASAPVCKTPHGRAILLKSIDIPPTIRQSKIPGYPKLEIQGQGSIGVLPDTPGYEWLTELPDTIPSIGNFRLWFDSAFPSKQRLEPTFDEGERDNHLSRLLSDADVGRRHAAVVAAVSWLKARRVGYASIQTILQPYVDKWKLQNPPYTQQEFDKDIDDVFKRYNPVEVKGLPPRAEFATINQLRKTKVVQTPLIDGLMMPKQKIALVGWEGVGKSTLAITLTVEVALGLPVFGVFPVRRPLKVAYMDMEIGKEGTLRFFDKVTQGRGDPPDDMIGIYHCREKGAEVKVDMTRPALLEATKESIVDFRPDLLILDGWYLFVSENDQDQVRASFDFLDNIREVAGCSVMICHHTKKVGAPMFTPQNILELASGWGLMRWAETKLMYKPVIGMPGWAIINGRSRIPEWNPIAVLVEYIRKYNLIEARDETKFLSETQLNTLFPLGRRHRDYTAANFQILLKKVMELGDISQVEIARLTGADQSQVSKWLSGAVVPNQDRIRTLSEKLAELELGKATDNVARFPDEFEEESEI